MSIEQVGIPCLGYLSYKIVLMVPINTTMHIFWRHPVAIIFLIFYTMLCVGFARMVLQFHERMKLNPGMSGIALGGEGVGYGAFFLVIIGFIFGMVVGGFAIGSKTGTKFYLWLILIIIVETITAVNID